MVTQETKDTVSVFSATNGTTRHKAYMGREPWFRLLSIGSSFKEGASLPRKRALKVIFATMWHRIKRCTIRSAMHYAKTIHQKVEH